jgi:competence protein ComEC
MITGDGRNLGIVSQNGMQLMILREGRSSFTRNEMLEVAGMAGSVAPLDRWPGASCNHDFCLVELSRGGRIWRLLIARTLAGAADEALARACAGVDIVIAQQKLFGACHPALIKADRTLLMRTGGLALDLVNRQVTSVEAGEGDHPWWRAPHRMQTEYDDQATASDAAVPAGSAQPVVPGPGLSQ